MSSRKSKLYIRLCKLVYPISCFGQCNFNQDKAITDANCGITSTSVCQQDETAGTFRDQQCKYIALPSEYEYAVRFKSSTDGINCIVKRASVHSLQILLVTRQEVHRQLLLTLLLPYAEPRLELTFHTELLQQFVQTIGKCTLMTGCVSAKDDVTRNQACSRCSWNSTTKVCAKHTYHSQKTQVCSCRYFYNWHMKKYNICSTVSGKCIATDAATLAEGDCYKLTAYQFSCNPTSSKCIQCGTVVPETNNSNSTTKGTTTDSGYILAWASAILAYLIMQGN